MTALELISSPSPPRRASGRGTRAKDDIHVHFGTEQAMGELQSSRMYICRVAVMHRECGLTYAATTAPGSQRSYTIRKRNHERGSDCRRVGFCTPQRQVCHRAVATPGKRGISRTHTGAASQGVTCECLPSLSVPAPRRVHMKLSAVIIQSLSLSGHRAWF